MQVHEADISKLKQGQRATITTDSYPGVLMQGEVTRIASVANSNNDWGGSSEVKKFDVEVTMQAPDVKLRPGISAKVEIHVEVREKALFVPLQSVFAEEGEHFCHVQAPGGAPQRRKLKVGKSNDNYLEVEDGLQEGDLVLLYNPLLPETGGKPDKDSKREPAAPAKETPPPPTPGKAGP
jgi:HlyD family secretion protein